MSKFIVKSKRKRGVIRQEAHVWLKAIERGVVYHEVNDTLCNIALINLEACAATRLPSVYKTIILPHLRKKIPLGGGHVENESGTEDGEGKTNLVLTPALSERGPLTCDACDVTYDSHSNFTEHCKCFSHKQALAATPVPDEWVDPRLLDNADATLELHELPRAVVAWRDRVYTILRTIDDAGMARMGEIATESHDVMEEYEWWDRENAVWTAEKAHADILEGYVIKDFRNFGLWPCFNSYNMGYALSIITEGWANFNFVGTHDTRMFNATMADNGAGNYC
tara:strand:- start:2340 stop:3182 length:843 start_codon:yes stop_codon:yes gene_type:complete